MTLRRARQSVPVIVLAGALLLTSAGHGQAPQNPMTMNPMMAAGATPRDLTQAELDRYLKVLEQLVAAGVDAERELGANPTEARKRAAGIKYTNEISGVVESNGFDQETFSEIHWNVMMAYAATEMDGKEDEIAKAKKEQAAQMKKMKESMSPAQYEAVMKSMGQMNAFMDAYENVPEGNKTLVRKNKAKIQTILESAN